MTLRVSYSEFRQQLSSLKNKVMVEQLSIHQVLQDMKASISWQHTVHLNSLCAG